MDTKKFLQFILPESGYFYIVVKKTRWAHSGYVIADIARAADTSVSKGLHPGNNVYFTPSTFQKATQSDGRSFRKLENFALARTLWADIDTGEGKRYPNHAAALEDIQRFVEATGLHPSVVVNSGGGWHVYWRLSESLQLVDFKTLQVGFKDLLRSLDIGIDPQVTSNPVSVLRVPGTLNHKFAEPQRVVASSKDNPPIYDVAAMRSLLPKQSVSMGTGKAKLSGALAELAGDTQGPPGNMERLIDECPLMAHVLETNGAGCNEPMWKDVLSVVYHLEESRKWAHEVSKGHKDYSEAETEQKLAARGGAGPALCITLADSAKASGLPDKCTECPHTVKSPIVLSRAGGAVGAPIAMPEDQPLPYGYEWTATGVYQLKKDKEGVEVRQFAFRPPITDVRLHRWADSEGTVEEFIEFDFKYPRSKHTQTGSFPIDCLAEQRKLYGALTQAEFAVQKKSINAVGEFMESWIEILRERRTYVGGTQQMGWLVDEGKHAGFVAGETVYLPDGNAKPGYKLAGLTNLYTPRGTPAAWVKAAKLLFKQNNPQLLTILASAFAAPLFNFLGRSSSVLSVVSEESGVGKTTVMKVAQAVWGDPIRGVNALDDTENALSKKLATLRHLPLYWDELRLEADIQSFIKMAFRLAQGKDKSRMNSDTSLRRVGSWETIMVVASNHSLLDLVSATIGGSDAASLRFVEYNVEPALDGLSAAERSTITTTVPLLRDNYGHAGATYAQYLAQHHEQARELVVGIDHALGDTHNFSARERFWASTVACLLAGCKLSNDAGVARFDMKVMQDFLMVLLASAREQRVEHVIERGAEDTLSGFIRFVSDKTLITEEIVAVGAQGRPPGNTKIIVHQPSHTREILMQVGKSSRTYRTFRRVLMEYLAKQRKSYRSFTQELHRQGYQVVPGRTTIGAGTTFSSGQAQTVDIIVPAGHPFLFDED